MFVLTAAGYSHRLSIAAGVTSGIDLLVTGLRAAAIDSFHAYVDVWISCRWQQTARRIKMRENSRSRLPNLAN